MKDEKLEELIIARKRGGQKHCNKTTWKKGENTGNRNGRPKGSKNRWSKTIKEEIERAFGWNIVTLRKDLESMTPMERIKAFALLGKFILTEKKKVNKNVNKVDKIEVSFSDDFTLTPIEIEKERKRIEAIELEFDQIEEESKGEETQTDEEPKND